MQGNTTQALGEFFQKTDPGYVKLPREEKAQLLSWYQSHPQALVEAFSKLDPGFNKLPDEDKQRLIDFYATSEEPGYGEAIISGLKSSILGMLLTRELPPEEHFSSITKDVLHDLMQVGADSFIYAGAAAAGSAAAGGNPIVGTVAAFAAHDALARLIADKYVKNGLGKTLTADQELNRVLGSALKGGAVGLATGGAGTLGRAVSPALGAAAEVATLPVASHAVYGTPVTTRDFIKAGFLIGGIHGLHSVGRIIKGLQKVSEKTNTPFEELVKHPEEHVDDIKTVFGEITPEKLEENLKAFNNSRIYVLSKKTGRAIPVAFGENTAIRFSDEELSRASLQDELARLSRTPGVKRTAEQVQRVNELKREMGRLKKPSRQVNIILDDRALSTKKTPVKIFTGDDVTGKVIGRYRDIAPADLKDEMDNANSLLAYIDAAKETPVQRPESRIEVSTEKPETQETQPEIQETQTPVKVKKKKKKVSPPPEEVSPIEYMEQKTEIAAKQMEDTTIDKPQSSRIKISGKEDEARTEPGTKIKFHYALMDAPKIISSHDENLNPSKEYPKWLQPRDRDREAMIAQIRLMMANLDPGLLGYSYKVSDGAPLVGRDGIVEAGNGRIAALKGLYKIGKADVYKKWLKKHAKEFGFTPEDIDKLKHPVLVRVRDTKVPDRVAFAKEANIAGQATESATEQAKNDVPALLQGDELLRSNPDLDIDSAANKGVIASFLGRVASKSDINRYVDKHGSINADGLRRFKNALFGAVYGKQGKTLEKLAESTDDEIKNVTNGLMQAALAMGRAKKKLHGGEAHDYDIANELAQAVSLFREAKSNGVPVENLLRQARIGEEISPLVKDIVRTLEQNKRSSKKIGNVFRTYAKKWEELGSPKQKSLIDLELPSKDELFKQAVKEAQGMQQETLFGETLPENKPEEAKPAETSKRKVKKTPPKQKKTAKVSESERELSYEEMKKIAEDLDIPIEAVKDYVAKGGKVKVGPKGTKTDAALNALEDDPISVLKDISPDDTDPDKLRIVYKYEPGETARAVANVLRTTRRDVLSLVAPEVDNPIGKRVKVRTTALVRKIARSKDILNHTLKQDELFWEGRSEKERLAFMLAMEEPDRFKELPQHFREMAKVYRQLLDNQWKKENELGIIDAYRDNYFAHIYDNPQEVSKFLRKLKKTLGKDRFAKMREIDLLREALAAGYKLRNTNPAWNIAYRLVTGERAILVQQELNKMVEDGLARVKTEGDYATGEEIEYGGPDGKTYIINGGGQVLVNMLGRQAGATSWIEGGLWNADNIAGMGYRGLMRLKNLFVPMKLSLSLFHPLHIATIDTSAKRTEIYLDMLEGDTKGWLKNLLKASVGIGKTSTKGMYQRLVEAWTDPSKAAELDPGEYKILQYLQEAGGAVKPSHEWVNNATEAFRKAIAQNKKDKALLMSPVVLVEQMQKPMFSYWIPMLKVTHFARQAADLIRRHPELENDYEARASKLQEIWRSVDNRYGEMQYDTLAWNRFLKDITIGSSLSMGWTYGFIREYGHAIIDTAKWVKRGMKREDITGRMLFTLDYTVQSLAIGGLITWLAAGRKPDKMKDLVFPDTGIKDQDGKPVRLNMPFYTKEPASWINHARKQGYIKGTLHYFANKANPVLKALYDLWRNKDFYDTEIRDPHDPATKQMRDAMMYFIEESGEPISLQAMKKSRMVMPGYTATVLPILGLNVAPRYVALSKLEIGIASDWDKTYSVTLSHEARKKYDMRRKLRQQLYKYGAFKVEDLSKAIKEGVFGYGTPGQIKGRIKLFIRNSFLPTHVRLFRRLPPDKQLYWLNKMTPTELKKYLPYASKEAKVKYIMAHRKKVK